MRKIKFILGCATSVIRKYIFKSQNASVSHECERVLESINFKVGPEEENREAEYLSNYSLTTRWQTI